jgi:hypothetical protein
MQSGGRKGETGGEDEGRSRIIHENQKSEGKLPIGRAGGPRDTYWDNALGDGGVRTIKTHARKEWNQGPWEYRGRRTGKKPITQLRERRGGLR